MTIADRMAKPLYLKLKEGEEGEKSRSLDASGIGQMMRCSYASPESELGDQCGRRKGSLSFVFFLNNIQGSLPLTVNSTKGYGKTRLDRRPLLTFASVFINSFVH